MRKSVLGWAVAGATLASAIAFVPPAFAITLFANFKNTKNVAASGVSHTWTGLSRTQEGKIYQVSFSENVSVAAGGTYKATLIIDQEVLNLYYEPKVTSFNFSYPDKTTDPGVPVPWDISGSATIIGSITGIGLGLTLRRFKNRKDINIKE
jgi:hypothetical protein